MKKYLSFIFSIMFIIAVFSLSAKEKYNDGVERVTVEKARDYVLSGKALLVCSYDERRCGELMLDGAISKKELETKLSSLPKNQEIIFYCA